MSSGWAPDENSPASDQTPAVTLQTRAKPPAKPDPPLPKSDIRVNVTVVQSAILLRDAGVSISRATMDGWVMSVGGLLIPVAAATGRELVAGGYIQADETPILVQMHDKSGKNHQAYLWQYGRPGGGVVFDFQMGRGREGPKNFIGQFAGILQTRFS